MWKYIEVYDSKCCMDDQRFGDTLSRGYEIAKGMSNPVFVQVVGDTSVYVVVYDGGTMAEDTEWVLLIEGEE